jgi:succinoglycan biosynthesis transport protein ExoP
MRSHDGGGEAPWVVSLRKLRRRWAVIALCVLLVAGSAFAFSITREKRYSASASLLFRDAQLDQALSGGSVLPPSIDPEREGNTNLRLLSLPVVTARTAKRLDVPLGRIAGEVEVAPQGESDVFSVTAKDSDPKFAARVANAFSREYIAFRRQADRRTLDEAEAVVRKQIDRLSPSQRDSRRGETLDARLEQLQVLSSLQTGNAELVEKASVPSSPSEPRPVRNAVLGGVLGLLLGVLITFLLERFDRRFQDLKEVEDIFDRPVLAGLPESREIESATGPVATEPTGVGEAFRILQANLRFFDFDASVRAVAVTSAVAGEGKSTVAWNLAAASAAAGARALLIDADLRDPDFEVRYGVSSPGLTAVLMGGTFSQSVVQYSLASDGSAGSTMDVLPAGQLPPNPTDLLLSGRMSEVIAEAMTNYDLVVLDTPPISIVSDATLVMKEVSGVIVVIRLGKTPREAAARLNEKLANLGARILGVVANGLSSRDADDYGYGYGYPSRAPTSPLVTRPSAVRAGPSGPRMPTPPGAGSTEAASAGDTAASADRTSAAPHSVPRSAGDEAVGSDRQPGGRAHKPEPVSPPPAAKAADVAELDRPRGREKPSGERPLSFGLVDRKGEADPEADASAPAERAEASPLGPDADPEVGSDRHSESATATEGAAVDEDLVDLNQASFEELRELGMSITQAKRVIAHRESENFESLGELDDLPGFSRAFLAELKLRVQV